MICECSRCRFSIAAGNADNFTVAFVAVSQFYFTNNFYSFCSYLFHHLIFFRNARAFHHFISIQNFFIGVPAFFKFNSGIQQLVAIDLFQRTSVCKKHIIPFLFCQQRSADSTLTSAEYDKFLFHISLSLLSLSEREGGRALRSFSSSVVKHFNF